MNTKTLIPSIQVGVGYLTAMVIAEHVLNVTDPYAFGFIGWLAGSGLTLLLRTKP